MINASLSKANRAGKVFCIVFSCAAAFSALFAILFVALQVVAGESVFSDPALAAGAIYSLIETGVMFAVYVLCARLAYDVSRGMTPFCKVQVKRITMAGWLMLAITLLGLVWDPITSPILASSSSLAVGFEVGQDSVDFHINFGALVATGAFFLFSYILNYGKTLQELADETA